MKKDDDYLIPLAEIKFKELLEKYGFPGDKTPTINGSKLLVLIALENEPLPRSENEWLDDHVYIYN